ncbi:cytochrome c oxidase assembly protein [Alsobacter sp. SYSU M60028]|uniref:Cytochrome c oxidase assembly protein n=1 Tax=Alsobacter ponti TaxID=2962936 RepID=A0ABT1L7H8_9HYPH|nr:cytochrome c oxidase assembly protein [Alsobacter ponti]MCP8937442.1 cytochrome c oxidase assembly protein [Alsobacter ponti]
MRRLTTLWLLATASLLPAAPALAHDSGATPETIGAFPALVGLSFMIAGLYATGWARRRRAAGTAPGHRTQAAAFASGLAVLLAALAPAADEMADTLFSAHMAQHLALVLIAAPLLAFGRAGLLAGMGLGRAPRRIAGRLGFERVRRTCHGMPGALLAWFAFCGVFAFWHLPGPYGWSLRSFPLHVLEHASLLASAYAFWAVALARPSAALGHGARLAYVGTAAVVSSFPGALMILAPRPFYAAHAQGGWGLTGAEDQQLAGLVMWIPGGLVYLGAMCWILLAWFAEAERRARLARASLPAISLLLLLAAQGQARAAGDNSMPGDARQGARLIVETGCGACHVIPGITGATGLVGPPLKQIGRRVFLAGLLRNSPENMVTWLRDPQAIVPGNAMPRLGLSEAQARDIAAYLATLR